MKIAVLSGDGIGPEVISQAVRVLRAVRPDVECVEGLAGAAAIRAGEEPLPPATRSLCDASDAILFGSVGDAELDAEPFARRPEAALFSLRHDYSLFANLRPVRTYQGLEHASSLHWHLIAGLDLIVVRELTGGIYFGTPKEVRVDARGKGYAVDTMSYTEGEVDRIARVAFELAMRRRRHVTSVDKHNILATSRLWRGVVERVATEYPAVEVEHLLVDNAAMQIIRRPRDFDVIVTENMFGDILSDEAAMLTGSIGNLPSASLAGQSDRVFGMYEPIGGTAPDIAGRGIANPTAAILSAALLLRFSAGDEPAALRIENAIAQCFRDGVRTADLCSSGRDAVSTAAFGDAVLARLGL